MIALSLISQSGGHEAGEPLDVGILGKLESESQRQIAAQTLDSLNVCTQAIAKKKLA